MKLERLRELLGLKTVPSSDSRAEVAKLEIRRWEEAFLGKSLLEQDRYAVLLALRSNPSQRVYASLAIDSSRVLIDVPLEDHTPQEILAQRAYETTFFGQEDPEKYRAFATEEFTHRRLLALLNRTTAGVSPDETFDWFCGTFGVRNLNSYGSVNIISHGGKGNYGYSFGVWIENAAQIDAIAGRGIASAIDFAEATQKSLPHIRVNPLPIDAYLQDVQSTLKFLPRDWELRAGKTS
ncbi:hypothetical protein M1437_00785 [Patescibacteria group bacterium]|nr:hypothetical protein [Patescibacteria group bacterium]